MAPPAMEAHCRHRHRSCSLAASETCHEMLRRNFRRERYMRYIYTYIYIYIMIYRDPNKVEEGQISRLHMQNI